MNLEQKTETVMESAAGQLPEPSAATRSAPGQAATRSTTLQPASGRSVPQSSLLAFGASLTATTLFGLSFLFIKVALAANGGQIFDLLSYRFILSSLMILILAGFKVIRLEILQKGIRPLLLLCLFNPVIYYTVETLGVSRIASSEAGLMLSIFPVSTTIFGVVFLKERVTRRQILFAAISISGVILINICSYVPGDSSNLGRFLMLLCILTGSSFGITSRRLSTRYTPFERTAAMIFAGAIFFTTVAVATNLRGGTMGRYLANAANPGLVMPVLYLSIACSIIAFGCSNYAITHLPVSRNAVMGNFSPVVSITAGVLILKETLQWYHLVGTVIILCGVIGTTLIQASPAARTAASSDAAQEPSVAPPVAAHQPSEQ